VHRLGELGKGNIVDLEGAKCCRIDRARRRKRQSALCLEQLDGLGYTTYIQEMSSRGHAAIVDTSHVSVPL